MLKSNNFSYYVICKLSLVNIKIPSFSFLKKAIFGLHKKIFWHISRKIGKILIFFEKGPFKALLNQRKIFSKRLLKMHSFPKKKIYLKKMSVHPLGRILSYLSPFHSLRVLPTTTMNAQVVRNESDSSKNSHSMFLK